MAPPRELVLILDYGAQYAQLIARRIRESHVYCEVHPHSLPLAKIRALGPKAIVLSGGPSSVYAPDAPTAEAALFDLGIPMLGICYGVQLMAHLLGGKVEHADAREYGPAEVRVEDATGIFSGFTKGEALQVWMSHGDRIAALPPGFQSIGTSANTPLCAIAEPRRKIFGIQFHPEVAHTPRGGEILRAFLFEVVDLSPSWTPSSFAEEAVQLVQQKVGPRERAICGLSGGVDSSVAAVLCHRAIGERLTCVFVDNGVLREGEGEQVVHLFRDTFHMPLVHIDARERFLTALRGITE